MPRRSSSNTRAELDELSAIVEEVARKFGLLNSAVGTFARGRKAADAAGGGVSGAAFGATVGIAGGVAGAALDATVGFAVNFASKTIGKATRETAFRFASNFSRFGSAESAGSLLQEAALGGVATAPFFSDLSGARDARSRAVSRTKAQFANLARIGVDVSDEAINFTLDRTTKEEQRSEDFSKRVDALAVNDKENARQVSAGVGQMARNTAELVRLFREYLRGSSADSISTLAPRN